MIEQLSENQQSSIKHQTPCNRESIRVAVLRGGVGSERQVSLESGRCIVEALQAAGLNVVASDIRPDEMRVLDRRDIDVFFLALHGEFGEDGRLQQILDDRGLVYTGSGPEASRLAFDKVAAKQQIARAGVAIPAGVEFSRDMEPAELEQQLHGLGERLVVKPIREGSSVGVHIVDSRPAAVAAARQVLAQFGDCMVESFIAGREITVGILERQALPIIEIRSRTGFYDYEAKYVDERTEYLFDTIADPDLRARVQQAALTCFDALDCRDFARVDFILGTDGTPYALELNTIPGFTTHSLLPKAAARVGLSMSELCTQIVRAARTQRKRG
jgi:D-alanine-D-alanine ligase